ncbi:hypothetical protein Q4Q35_13185 [Flavivirga aquimarina]|uniref:Glycosyltransferase RgtA/B/C/D-like domain-containing protein n=1 Tax=Flavivirga aquimarina TaxID=2027862 RepID=A0ABT8WC94_9FLAO|nr:hypothetical protein [Flavivirga aquimarina]MDO5970765.1 hypothetical protein [Flavivirga aquimarina]
MPNRFYFFVPHILVLLTILVFFPTFFNDFQTGWDDKWQVLENPFIVDHSFEQLRFHFSELYRGQYSPINTLLYIVLYELFGFNPMAFHAAFLIIHILNVLLVYSIIKAVIKQFKPELKIPRMQLYAGCISLIFAIHPLQVESVAWVSASKIILYAFFMLLAIWCYIKYIDSYKTLWLFLMAILYALSYGSKEQAIIMPLNLFAIDFIFGRYIYIKLNATLLRKRVFLEKLPFLCLGLGFWYFASLFNIGSLVVENSYPFHQRILFGMHSMVEYIFRAIAPVKLFYYYFFPIKIGEELPLFYWSYLLLTIIIVGFIWSNYKKNNKLVVFGFFFFIINILLVLHILPFPRPVITADRYMYISIIGISIIGVWFFDWTLHNFLKYKKLLFSIATFYLVAIAIQSYNRTLVWKDSATMKKNVKELVEKRKALKQPIINSPLTDNDE